MPAFFPPSWCPWVEWSVCSVEPCDYDSRPPVKKPLHPPKEVVLKEYCVNFTKFPIFALHWPEGNGNVASQRVGILQKRRRQCRCKNLKGLLNSFFMPNCEEYKEQVECSTCVSSSSGVYSHTQKGERLRSCAELAEARGVAATAFANSNKFYAILGSALGAAAFLIIVFCCVRFFLLSSAARRHTRRSANTGAGRGAGDGAEEPIMRRSANTLPYPHFYSLSSELPPAYKDVVAMTTILLSDATEINGGPGQCLPPRMPLDGGDMRSDNATIDEPPPPSYRDVIAFSASAADMHRRLLAEAAVTST